MASRNRAHALVNRIFDGHHGVEDDIAPNPEDDVTTFSAVAPMYVNNRENQDLIELEDLMAADPPTFFYEPPSRPTSVASLTQGSSTTFCDDFSPDDDSEYEPPNHNAVRSESDSNEDQPRRLDDINESPVHFGDMNEGQRRQRKAQPETWKKNLSKQLRMEGKEYNGYERPRGEKVRNIIRRPRALGPRCVSDFCTKSKIRSCADISEEDRQSIFQKFWTEMDWHQRKVYVANNVTFQGKARQTSENSRRSGTYVYFLPIHNPTENTSIKKRVCREMFLQTLCLGSFSVQNWAKKGRCGMHPSEKNINRRRARVPLFQRRTEVLNSFLNQLPKMPSHYNRQNTSKVYLEPIYRNAAHLYITYKQFCVEKEEQPYARNKFHTEVKSRNIAIHTIKKDMCDICVGHQTGNVTDEDFHTHQLKKNRARQEKQFDKSEALKGNCIVLTMDLQAVKVCPFITASAVYYKTKLCVHNFSIYDLASHDCTCYWFNETDGDLTASTYASFITDYLTRHCLPKRLPIIIYSDGCTSQNRNNILANALLNFSIQHEVSIVQKYLEVGHTQMEGDCVHSAIERKLKNRLVHLPSDFLSVTKEARKNPREYEAIMVNYNFFKNFSDPATWRYTSIRPGRRAGDPKVTDIRAILYDKEGDIKVKLDFDSNWEALPQRANKIGVVREYKPLHKTKINITLQKFKHLQELKSVIPLDCHSFYDDLPHHDH